MKVLIVFKEHHVERIIPAIQTISKYISKGNNQVFIDESIKTHLSEPFFKHPTPLNFEQEGFFDRIITLGGDGTVLNASWKFQNVKTPPILAFNFGTLGFLTVFKYENETIQEVLENNLFNSKSFNERMRLNCSLNGESKWQVLNDIVLDRGDLPTMILIEVYLVINGGKRLLTILNSDGLIVSTPTGSTAYSMSAGGSLVHPSIPAIMLTPICPHSLSLRPFILSDSVELELHIKDIDSRYSSGWLSCDSRVRVKVQSGDYIRIKASKYPAYTINNQDETSDWFSSLRSCLYWNEIGRSDFRSLLHN